MAAHRTGNISTAFFHLDLHIELAAVRQVCDYVCRIDNLDIVGRLDVSSSDNAFRILTQAQGNFVAVVEFEDHALEVEQDVYHIFLNPVDRRILVQHASNRHLGCRVTRHRGQQHPTQSISERVAVTALKRLQRNLGAVQTDLLDTD